MTRALRYQTQGSGTSQLNEIQRKIPRKFYAKNQSAMYTFFCVLILIAFVLLMLTWLHAKVELKQLKEENDEVYDLIQAEKNAWRRRSYRQFQSIDQDTPIRRQWRLNDALREFCLKAEKGLEKYLNAVARYHSR